MLDLQEFGGVVARLQVSEFREYANWHHESLGDDSAELDGADADGFLQHIAVLVTPGAEAAVVKEGEAFVVGRKRRVDFEIDGAVSGAEFIASSDDAPGFAGDGDHVQTVGLGDGVGCCEGDFFETMSGYELEKLGKAWYCNALFNVKVLKLTCLAIC